MTETHAGCHSHMFGGLVYPPPHRGFDAPDQRDRRTEIFSPLQRTWGNISSLFRYLFFKLINCFVYSLCRGVPAESERQSLGAAHIASSYVFEMTVWYLCFHFRIESSLTPQEGNFPAPCCPFPPVTRTNLGEPFRYLHFHCHSSSSVGLALSKLNRLLQEPC